MVNILVYWGADFSDFFLGRQELARERAGHERAKQVLPQYRI